MCRRILLLSILFLFPVILHAQFAQWEDDPGVSVRSTSSVEEPKAMCSNSEGYTLFSWVEGNRENSNLLAMLVDVDGNQVWDSPITVCDQPGAQIEPSILALPGNEWIIGWKDARHSSNLRSAVSLYLQKFDNNGNTYYSENGMLVVSTYTTIHFSMIRDDSNGFIVCWSDYINETTNLYVQHFDNSGNSTWDNGGVLAIEDYIRTGAHNPFSAKLAQDDEGGVIIAVYHRYLEDSIYLQNIRVQRVNNDGDIMWTDSPYDSLFISTAISSNSSFDIAKDGESGAYIVWKEQVDYATPHELKAQHVSADGEVYWNEGGEIISLPDIPNLERLETIQLCQTSSNEAIVVFDYETTDSWVTHLLMQKISGETFTQHWGDGSCVSLADHDVFPWHYSIVPDENGGIFAAWTHAYGSTYFNYRVIVQHVSSEGQFLWPGDNGYGVEVQGQSAGKYPLIQRLNEDRVITAWRSASFTGYGIKAQIVEDASLVLPGSALTLVEKIDGSGFRLEIIPSEGYYYVVWVDDRTHLGPDGYVPYMQKLDENGTPLWEENGNRIFQNLDQSITLEGDLKYCSDGNGGLYLSWTQRPDRIGVVQHVSADGILTWGESGLSINDAHSPSIEISKLIHVLNGDFIVFYLEQINNSSVWLQKCMRYNQNAQPVWSEPVTISNQDVPEISSHLKDVIKLEWNEYVFLLKDYLSGYSTRLVMNKINANGDLRWSDYILIPDNSINSDDEDLNLLNENILLSYQRDVEWGNRRIKARLISPEGDYIWSDEARTLFMSQGYKKNLQVRTSGRNSQMFWVGWREEIERRHYRLYSDRFNTQGYSIGDSVISVGLSAYVLGNYEINLEVLHDNSAIFAWKRIRDFEDWELVFKHLDSEGNLVTSPTPYPNIGVIIGNQDLFNDHLDIAKTGESGFVAAWTEGMHGDQFNLRVQKFDDGYTGIKEVVDSTTPLTFNINNAWPNPFNPSINIAYELSKPGLVKISVYDILGREVAVLLNDQKHAGQHMIFWNGMDSNSKAVASGTYFLKMEADKQVSTRKVMLVK